MGWQGPAGDLTAAWAEASGMPIPELVQSWTSKMGFPVLRVLTDPFENGGALEVEQQWFLAGPRPPRRRPSSRSEDPRRDPQNRMMRSYKILLSERIKKGSFAFPHHSWIIKHTETASPNPIGATKDFPTTAKNLSETLLPNNSQTKSPRHRPTL